MRKLESKVLHTVKSISDKQVKDAIDKRCFIWCYEPTMPKAIKKLRKSK